MGTHKRKHHDVTGSLKDRLSFIERRLYWFGRFNRRELEERFNLSATRQTLDMATYKELAEGTVVYDRYTKAYHPTSEFKPIFTEPDEEDFTALLLEGDLKGGLSEGRLSISPNPIRGAEGHIVREIMQAIDQGVSLTVLYVSMSSPAPKWREISPHAMGTDGQRWHVRAFCHESELFKDYVLGRFLEIGERGPARGNPEEDKEWNEYVDIIIGPDPRLKGGAKLAIEKDFCMQAGEAVLKVRKALKWYVLKQWNLDGKPFEDPRRQQVVLNNPDILE